MNKACAVLRPPLLKISPNTHVYFLSFHPTSQIPNRLAPPSKNLPFSGLRFGGSRHLSVAKAQQHEAALVGFEAHLLPVSCHPPGGRNEQGQVSKNRGTRIKSNKPQSKDQSYRSLARLFAHKTKGPKNPSTKFIRFFGSQGLEIFKIMFFSFYVHFNLHFKYHFVFISNFIFFIWSVNLHSRLHLFHFKLHFFHFKFHHFNLPFGHIKFHSLPFQPSFFIMSTSRIQE